MQIPAKALNERASAVTFNTKNRRYLAMLSLVSSRGDEYLVLTKAVIQRNFCGPVPGLVPAGRAQTAHAVGVHCWWGRNSRAAWQTHDKRASWIVADV